MTNEPKNVPELRFPGFDEEWELHILGECVTNKTRKFNSKKDDNESDIELDSLESDTGRLIHLYNSTEFSSQKNRFKKGDVLYSKLRPYLNKYYFADFDGVCSSEIWVLNSKDKSILKNKFLYSFIQTNKFSFMANKSAGSKMPRADWNLVENMRLNLPTVQEQQKIGGFFSKLDRQIELEEQKLVKLEEQKKGYMQKIFSQELRFKDDNGNDYPNWENEKLGDLINEVNERTTSNNQYVLLSSTKNGLLSQEEYFKKQIGSKDSTGYKILRLNQLVLSPQNLWLGNINFNQRFDIGIVSPSYRIYNLSNQFDINFAKDLLKSPRYIYEYAQASEQGASVVRRNLNLELFYSIKISLPSIEEQRKIGAFLNKLDKLMRKQYNKIEVLKQRKQGLLQKMFV